MALPPATAEAYEEYPTAAAHCPVDWLAMPYPRMCFRMTSLTYEGMSF